ncbi:MAG: hypothetical protein V2I76_08550 [Roseobacter sp.]|jgi:hypothetical protein|nr:hypothetical protein [Roseobacter sp.]
MPQRKPEDAPDLSVTATPAEERLPLLGADWEQRLQQARDTRKKVRASASGKGGSVRGQGDASQSAKSSSPAQSATSWMATSVQRFRASANSSGVAVARLRDGVPSGRLALVFAGATGFGLGIGLAFGVLIGMGTQPPVSNATMTQNESAEPSQASSRLVGVLTSPTEIGAGIELGHVREASFVKAAAAAMAPASARYNNPVVSQTAAPVLSPASLAVSSAGVSAMPPSSVQRTEPPVSLLGPDDWQVTDAAYRDPNGLKPQFFLHAPTGLSPREVQYTVARLKEAGVDLSKIGREHFRVSQTHLRYYSAQTAPVAMAIAHDLGVEARDFSGLTVSDQRVEIWVSGPPEPVKPSIDETSRFFRSLWAQVRDAR